MCHQRIYLSASDSRTGSVRDEDRYRDAELCASLDRGFVSLVMALMTETPRLSSLLPAGGAVLYAGVMSGAIAYTLQGVGQKRMQNPTAASLIMSLEAVFGVLAGWLLIGEALSPRKLLGCVILFCAIVLAQL